MCDDESSDKIENISKLCSTHQGRSLFWQRPDLAFSYPVRLSEVVDDTRAVVDTVSLASYLLAAIRRLKFTLEVT